MKRTPILLYQDGGDDPLMTTVQAVLNGGHLTSRQKKTLTLTLTSQRGRAALRQHTAGFGWTRYDGG